MVLAEVLRIQSTPPLPPPLAPVPSAGTWRTLSRCSVWGGGGLAWFVRCGTSWMTMSMPWRGPTCQPSECVYVWVFVTQTDKCVCVFLISSIMSVNNVKVMCLWGERQGNVLWSNDWCYSRYSCDINGFRTHTHTLGMGQHLYINFTHKQFQITWDIKYKQRQ